jgi:hypothetical protein
MDSSVWIRHFAGPTATRTKISPASGKGVVMIKAILRVVLFTFILAASSMALAANVKFGPVSVAAGQSVSFAAMNTDFDTEPLVRFRIFNVHGDLLMQSDYMKMPAFAGVEFEVPEQDFGAVPPVPCIIVGVVQIKGDFDKEDLAVSFQLVDQQTGAGQLFFPRKPFNETDGVRDQLVYSPHKINPLTDMLRLTAIPPVPCIIVWSVYDLNGNLLFERTIHIDQGEITVSVDPIDIAGIPPTPCIIVGIVRLQESTTNVPFEAVAVTSFEVQDRNTGATTTIQVDKSNYNVEVFTADPI